MISAHFSAILFGSGDKRRDESMKDMGLETGHQHSWTLSGFHGKARVATIFGELPIEALRLRDELKTPLGRYLRVAWLDRINLDEDFLAGNRSAMPVLVRRNALARDVPKNDLMISPAQMLMVPEGRAPGKPRSGRDLEKRHPGVLHKPVNTITYYRFHCGQAVQVLVEGVWCPTAP